MKLTEKSIVQSIMMLDVDPFADQPIPKDVNPIIQKEFYPQQFTPSKKNKKKIQEQFYSPSKEIYDYSEKKIQESFYSNRLEEQFISNKITSSPLRILQESPTTLYNTKQINERTIKRESYYKTLENYEKYCNTLKIYIQICTDLCQNIEKKCQGSQKRISIIINLLKELISIEEEKIKLSKKQGNEQIYQDGFNQILPELCQFYTQMQLTNKQNIHITEEKVRKLNAIINNKIELNFKNYSQKMKVLQNKFQQGIYNYQEQLKKNQKYLKKYQNLFNEIVSHQEKQQVGFQDYFLCQFKVINGIQETQSKSMEVGYVVLGIFDEIIRLESLRYEIIIEALEIYINQNIPFSAEQLNILQVANLIIYGQALKKIETVKECEISLNFKELLNPFEKQYISEFQGTLIDTDIKQFLRIQPLNIELYTYNNILNEPLILSILKSIQYDFGSLLSTWKDVISIITIDHNMLLFNFENENPFAINPKMKFSLINSQITLKKQNPIILEVKHVQKGFLFGTTKSIILKIQDQNELNIINQYVPKVLF